MIEQAENVRIVSKLFLVAVFTEHLKERARPPLASLFFGFGTALPLKKTFYLLDEAESSGI